MTELAEIDRFLRSATPEGKNQPEFHFYAARPKGGLMLSAPLSPETTRKYLLSDDTWLYRVEVFEVALLVEPAEVSVTLLRGLENLVAQGSQLAWLMFDAAFDDLSSLTTDWGAQNTYGIAGLKTSPELALGHSERQTKSWQRTLQRAVGALSQGFSNQG